MSLTLEELKAQIETICLSHLQIESFDFGEDYLLATGKGVDYPTSFLEIPYAIDYDLTNNKFKNLQFSLLVLLQPSSDNVTTDHQSISSAESIGDALISKMQVDLRLLGFLIESVNGISLREFSDDSVSGMRFDITGKFQRKYCKTNYEDQFEPVV